MGFLLWFHFYMPIPSTQHANFSILTYRSSLCHGKDHYPQAYFDFLYTLLLVLCFGNLIDDIIFLFYHTFQLISSRLILAIESCVLH